jgi:hypothetical protein
VPISKSEFEEQRQAARERGKPGAPKPAARSSRKLQAPFARIPLHWFPILRRARALTALPLLAAIAHEMAMRERRNIDDRNRIPITEQTWAYAGAPPTEGQRHAMLKALHRIPSIVRFEFRQRTGSKYAVYKGIWWNTAPERPQIVKDD